MIQIPNNVTNVYELIQWLDTNYNKNPGEYTKEDLIEIGLFHRNFLTDRCKDWKKLKNRVGYPGTSENYRNFIRYRAQKEDLVPTRTDWLTVHRESQKAEESEAESNYAELYKERVKLRDEATDYRRILREDARLDVFKEELFKHIDNLPKINLECSSSKSYSEHKEAVLMLCDLHIGVSCDNAYNKYNFNVAQERISKLVDDTIYYCKIHEVETLHVLQLGDMIHGIIHNNARLQQELNLIDQITKASELLSQALNKLQKAAPQITYRSVVDNHSRAIANKADNIEAENFNRLIDWYVEQRLKDSKIDFIHEDNIDIGIIKFNIKGKNIIAAHGHEDNINSCLQGYIGLTKEFIDYILLGHTHSNKLKEFQGCRVIVSGSIVGTEQYAFSKRLFSKASQTLLIFEDENLIDIKINLQK